VTNVVLRTGDLHWVDRVVDNPTDQCVHGDVELSAAGTTFVVPGGGAWNLTAAGLFLLRTLTENNTPSDSVCEGNYLFPCCGFNPMLIGSGKYPLVIQGCPNGIDVSVEHLDAGIRLSADGGKTALVSDAEWRAAVLGFAAQIEAWYARHPPRAEPGSEFDARGWEALWSEWKSRSEAARNSV
jgi:hypothetical protein